MESTSQDREGLTAAEVLALPERARRHIFDLETRDGWARTLEEAAQHFEACADGTWTSQGVAARLRSLKGKEE